MNLLDPQGLALPPSIDPKVELMDWLASPNGGALRMGQAINVAREIAHGRVPHVGMMYVPQDPFDPLTAHMVSPCGTAVSVDASHFDMCYVTTALVAQGWVVKLLQRAE